MTIQNWKEMVRKGVAGEETVTCFVAALDCLLEYEDIPYKVYAQYTEAYFDQMINGNDTRRTRNTIRKVLMHSIGSSCLKNILIKRASTETGVLDILKNATKGGKKIIFYVSISHVVGLKPLKNGNWLMVGNSVPYEYELTSEEIFQFMYIPPCTEKKDDRNNFYLIN